MRVIAKAEGMDPAAWANSRPRLVAEAVTVAMRVAASGMKDDMRLMIQRVGMGVRLGNAVRDASYPKAPRASARAVAEIRATGGAAQIIDAFSDNTVIRGKGKMLAIPTDAVPTGRYNRKLTPREVEMRFLQKLELRIFGGKPALVLVEGRTTRAGRARTATRLQVSRGKAREVVMFWLKPQVLLLKRLTPERIGPKWMAQLPSLIDRAAAGLRE